MNIDKYLTNKEDSLLLRFALTGGVERFHNKLVELISLAENEKWSCKNESTKNSILYSYILKTFEKVANEDKVMINSDETAACFNTGLLTPYGEDIICLFTKAKGKGDLSWYMEGFYADSDWKFVNNFDKTPEVATYFTNDSDLLFDTSLDIKINYVHILEDHFEERFPEELKKLDRTTIINLMKGSLDITKKKIQRNHRIVIPLYYKNKITYLLPITINGFKFALVVEKVRDTMYRANTIFTLDMAYSSARLLMKPETDWLVIE